MVAVLTVFVLLSTAEQVPCIADVVVALFEACGGGDERKRVDGTDFRLAATGQC